MKIGVLTSGGDAPGMNTFISNLVSLCEQKKFEVIAFKFGYQGLVDDNFLQLSSFLTDNIFHLGGSFIKSFRSSDFLTDQGYKKALRNIKKHALDALIIIGGDGTFKGAQKLCASNIPVIFIPATIDNDICFTEKCLGFDSALNSAVDYIDKIKQTMLSMNRIFVCEVMGRYSSELALNCAFATNATYLIEDKKTFNEEHLFKTIKKYLRSGKDSPSIIVRENTINVKELANKIQNTFDVETRSTIIGYVQRGATPSVKDRILARHFADFALNCAIKNKNKIALKVENNLISYDLINENMQKINKKTINF